MLETENQKKKKKGKGGNRSAEKIEKKERWSVIGEPNN